MVREQGDTTWEQEGGGTAGTLERWWHSGDTRKVVAQQGHQHGSRKVGSTKDACKVPLPHLGLHPEGVKQAKFPG